MYRIIFTIIYYSKNRDSLIYKNVLQRIKNKINNSDNNKYNIITNSIKFINKLTTLNIQNIDNNVIELNNFIKEKMIYIYHLVVKK